MVAGQEVEIGGLEFEHHRRAGETGAAQPLGEPLALALLVGQALTRPIQALQVASERVGAGNLGLRLPSDRADEFGAVFRAFNRMVGRLRRARRP